MQKEDGYWVGTSVEERIGKQVKWYQGNKEDALVQEEINRILGHELCVEEAVQIGLLNNPSLQAIFEEIGIAQADLVEAGLFQNPFFEGYARWPNIRTASFNAAFSITTSFIDVFIVPLRKKTAELQFEQAKIRVANSVLNLAADIEKTFYSLQAAINKLELQRVLIDVATAAGSLAEEQNVAGNVSDLFVEVKSVDLQQSMLELEHAEIEIISQREKLRVLLGLQNEDWKIALTLLRLPEQEVALENLETIALDERLDVAEARKEVRILASIGAQKRWWTYTNGQVGISWEQEADHIRELGPAFGFSIPIFNYGQADRARLLAQLRQSQAKLEALEITVKAQVKAAQDRLLKARKIAEKYQVSILPLRSKIIDSALEQYNVMTYGVYDLLRNKREELQSLINYEFALRDYWIARASLDLIVGGKLNLQGKKE